MRKKKEAVRRGSRPPLLGHHQRLLRWASAWRAWGAKRASEFQTLEIDPRGDRLQLADPFAKVGHLDPAACGGKSAVGRDLGQLHLLELEPAVPRLEPCEACTGEPQDDARAQHCNRQRVHHFSSLRSASISRASSSFWLLM